jgi:hypothetical protein
MFNFWPPPKRWIGVTTRVRAPAPVAVACAEVAVAGNSFHRAVMVGEGVLYQALTDRSSAGQATLAAAASADCLRKPHQFFTGSRGGICGGIPGGKRFKSLIRRGV